MNCRPGDLAVVVADRSGGKYLGRFVTVLRAAPVGVDFRLPDGKTHAPCPPNEWVVEFQTPVEVPLENGRSRTTRYACCKDAGLRPIRDPGDDAVDETLLRLPVPQKEIA